MWQVVLVGSVVAYIWWANRSSDASSKTQMQKDFPNLDWEKLHEERRVRRNWSGMAAILGAFIGSFIGIAGFGGAIAGTIPGALVGAYVGYRIGSSK
ncbi:hypothetical protein [Brachymonas sp. M4Q-1]|uniref:hypothetical protein n=1 Tax=Brachymonas sp. M4Q-1 TaxID=3416906 RepID=UPI003CF1A9DA